MVDVEIIEFKPPSGASKLIFLTQLEGEGYEEESLTQVLTEYFSQWGLIFTVKLFLEDDKKYIAFVRYYSALATASARQSNKGVVRLEDGKVSFRISRSMNKMPSDLPLSRSKCEELANYYLGFNSWSSSILYHRREEGEPDTLCYVTVVKLTFKQSGLDCEGAGKCEAPKEDTRTNIHLMAEIAKRSKGEAMQAAWSKVVLVVVDGKKVTVEVNTTKKDSFFYDPTWDEPEVVVNEIDS